MRPQLARAMMRLSRPERLRIYYRLQKEQWLPAEALAELSQNRLVTMLRHAGRNVPFYSDHCRESGLDPTMVNNNDLTTFPLLTKHDLMKDQERFQATDCGPEVRTPNATGGSSGVWFQFYVDSRTLDIRTANDWRSASWAGWSPGDKQAVLWGHPKDNKAAHSIRSRLMASLVHRSLNLNAYDMDESKLEKYSSHLTEWNPTIIRGYSSALAFLAEYMQRQGLHTPPPKGIISTAETLTDEHRTIIEKHFGCKVLNRYGSREFADIAQQCELAENFHIFNDRVHLEILRPDGTPCDHGERGEIVVTDLENRVMPFIRYRTGDLARTHSGTCSCGRGFPLLSAVEGRTSELIVGKNGKYYSCQSPRLFGADISGIGQMQLIQDTLEEIEIKIVPNNEWTPESKDQVIARMNGLLGDINLKVSLVSEIPPAPSGKYPFTISRVSPFTS